MNLDDEEEKEIGNDFKGKVDLVKRLQPAELNEEFYKNYFGNDEVKTEDEARAKVKDGAADFFRNHRKDDRLREKHLSRGVVRVADTLFP